MFLNYLKNLYLKYTLRNKWHELTILASTAPIQKVGLLLDATVFSESEGLIKELIIQGFLEENISVLVYTDTLNKKESYTLPTFNYDIINWNGVITEAVVNEFIATKFDVLISYYDLPKPILLLITNHSKAQFKVGFSSIDKRFNHLMITTSLEKYPIFVQELFKYLKILNKLE